MPTEANGDDGLAVVAGDVLALRGTGLAAAETWALLCQAAQALQDLFLSNGGVVGGSRTGPVVTPHTLELTARGRVLLRVAPPETARAYLPPEYRPGRVYSDTDSEKMWMYSLGRALLDTTPRVAALTGTVSVSPSSALQSVLAAMTEPDPRRRASLMNLLDVISEYCRTRMQSKPFTHTVMDMYREVVRSAQYAARKRAAYHQLNTLSPVFNPADRPSHHHHHQNRPHRHYASVQHQLHHCRPEPKDCHQEPQTIYQEGTQQQRYADQQLNRQQYQEQAWQKGYQSRQQLYQEHGQLYMELRQKHHKERQQQHYQQHEQPLYQEHQPNQRQHQNPVERLPDQFSKHRQQTHYHHHPHHHPQKSALFKAQLRNSRSHPNLSSLCGQQQPQHQPEAPLNVNRTQFQSELDIKTFRKDVYPALPYDQEEQARQSYHTRTNSQPVYSQLQQTRSNGNIPALEPVDISTDVYSDPIYALPVKPFLSSQDVRVNGLSAKTHAINAKEDLHSAAPINRHRSNGGYSQPDIAGQLGERLREDTYARTAGKRCPSLKRQHSNPQLSSRNSQEAVEFKRLSQPSIEAIEQHYRCSAPDAARNEEQTGQQQNPLSSTRARGAQGPPKPPRIITTLRKASLLNAEVNRSEPPAKPPRNMVRNGPRARRGKAVQRAPSRLYRTVGGPMRCFNKAQCVGPEFVVRANQPPKTLCVGQIKPGNSGRVVVIMLTGQRLEVTCDPQKVTAGDLFQAIVVAENLEENFTLGLAVLLAGDFAMLPPETKLNKVAPPGWLSSGKSKGLLGLPASFMLYLRLRFFLPSLRGIRNWISKHLLYLQIRRCILEQQLVCPFPELINLTGLALQAEFGNYNVNEHGCGDYFLLEHYVPESLILSMDQQRSDFNGDVEALKGQLHQAHRDRRGLDSNMAEEMFIVHAQALPDYGSHYYIATLDSKELEKVMTQQQLRRGTQESENGKMSNPRHDDENIYDFEKSSEHPIYGRIEFTRLDSRENIPKIPYGDETRAIDVYAAQKGKQSRPNTSNTNNNNNNNVVNNDSKNNSKNSSKLGKTKKSESSVWLAIHARGLKLFERGGEPRERKQLAEFQWRDIQTLSYSKSCLVVYSKLNGKRCKFKLRMDHRKSYFAFKLTSLHHQFFLKLRSELTSLQGLARDFGVPTTIEPKSSPSKKSSDGKTKIAIANTVKSRQRANFPMQLEEYQNKENENPQKGAKARAKNREAVAAQDQPGFYSSEEDALYAQVNVRLEPEGESRDTEDESERSPIVSNEPISPGNGHDGFDRAEIYGCHGNGADTETESAYSAPKIINQDVEQHDDKPSNPEDLYAAINKVGLTRKHEFPVPDEVWDVPDVQKSINKLKTSSLPNYATPKQSGGFRTPSLPRRLGVKMGTRAIYSSLVQKGTGLADDFESLSIKSDTASSIHSLSAQSTESPLPEAYVLNADIRTDDETFHVPDDESMSASLAARLEEMSFADERILHTIKLERGHGGSIGLQVTEGNDGGVYVQAVSVGGSADMAGNVNKGDRIVAINGQNLLNLRYEDALKMLQSSSETVELVLSQPASRKQEPRHDNDCGTLQTNYLHDIRFDVSSEAEISTMTNKWLSQKTTDVASVQNTSSAYSSAASSAMGNHNANSMYLTDLVDNDDLKSASMLLNIEDFDVSRTSRQVFI